MKKILLSLSFLLLLFFFWVPFVAASEPGKVVFYLTSTNTQEVAGNIVYFDLMANTLGTNVQEMNVQFFIYGPYDTQAMTFNLHPDHERMIHTSTPLSIVREDQILQGDNGVAVNVVLRARGDKPFNEGSAAIPLYRVGVKTNNPGELRAYVHSRTTVSYTDVSKNDYENYTPDSRPFRIQLLSGMVPAASPFVTEPSPTPVVSTRPSPMPTTQPQATPVSKYDLEFERVASQVAQLKDQVQQQERRVSYLERLIQNLRKVFGGLFR